jgi:hypothetical protein
MMKLYDVHSVIKVDINFELKNSCFLHSK